MINSADFDYYLSFSEIEFGEKFDEEKRNNSSQVGRLEAAHYTLCFLFDLL